VADIALVAAGARHVLAADARGQLWAWGAGSEGQLSAARSVRHRPAPLTLSSAPPLRVRALAAGDAHSFVLADAAPEQ
jgi:alpha-tubulin suppressor-like RCC1 family protein